MTVWSDRFSENGWCRSSERGNYSQGIYDTIQAYVATLAEKRGFSIEGIDQSYAYRGHTATTGEKRTSSGGLPAHAARFNNPRRIDHHLVFCKGREEAGVA